MARMEKLGAFALTEPDHGSDSIALETSARRDGSDYLIDGRKRWIGNGTVADLVVVWARDAEDGQVKGFLVETGVPGLEARKIEHKASVRAVWQADIDLKGVRVPAESRLPGADTFQDTGRVLASTRNTDFERRQRPPGRCPKEPWLDEAHLAAAVTSAIGVVRQAIADIDDHDECRAAPRAGRLESAMAR
jgi:hypothetical protein